MRFRPVRGALSSAMLEVVEIDPSMDALCTLAPVSRVMKTLGADKQHVRLEPQGFDSRIGWNSHIVVIDCPLGRCPVGYTDGPIQ